MKIKCPSLSWEKIIDICYNITLLIVGGIALYVCSQIFFFTSFNIPSDSMEPTLLPGDKIVVEKFSLGGRLFNLQKALEQEPVKISRAPGFSKIKRNEVIVFNWPYPANWDVIGLDMSKYYVKRCVGIPGDTLRISDGICRIQGEEQPVGYLPGQEKLQKQLSYGRTKSEELFGLYWEAYPRLEEIPWTIQEMGPFYIPGKGDSIPLDQHHFLLYRQLIEWEQKQDVIYRDSLVFVGGVQVQQYQFQKNYYFVAGDKADNSQDSRYWGLLPEEFIVGKAWLVSSSKDKTRNKYRKNRFLKRIK